jgi:hypothetical protein
MGTQAHFAMAVGFITCWHPIRDLNLALVWFPLYAKIMGFLKRLWALQGRLRQKAGPSLLHAHQDFTAA